MARQGPRGVGWAGARPWVAEPARRRLGGRRLCWWPGHSAAQREDDSVACSRDTLPGARGTWRRPPSARTLPGTPVDSPRARPGTEPGSPDSRPQQQEAESTFPRAAPGLGGACRQHSHKAIVRRPSPSSRTPDDPSRPRRAGRGAPAPRALRAAHTSKSSKANPVFTKCSSGLGGRHRASQPCVHVCARARVCPCT